METDIKTKSAKVWYAIGVLILTFIILWILSSIRNIVALLIICTLISYVLRPLVNFFANPISIKIGDKFKTFGKDIKLPFKEFYIKTKKGLPRVGAISLAFIIVMCIIAIIIMFVIPLIAQEMNNFYAQRHEYRHIIISQYENAVTFAETNIPSTFKPYILDMKKHINMDAIVNACRNAAVSMMPAVTNFMSSISHLILIPFVTFYMLMDYEEYRISLLSMVPKRKRKEIHALLGEIDAMLKQYIKGQILVCLIIGVSVTIAMIVLKIPYAILIGAFAGAIDVIPYVGVIISMIPSVLLAMSKGPIYALLTLGILYFIHWLEGHVIIPNIMGQSVKLPPLTVIIALIIGAETMGLIGMFLAIPVASIIRVVIEFYIKKRDEKEAAIENA